MEKFEYANPVTVQETLSLLGGLWTDAAVLAGGTDLISLMKDGVYAPKRLVNIKTIRELQALSAGKNGVSIGAVVTIDELVENPSIRLQYPAIHDAARGIASPQIRNMGTAGGDLCQRPRCWYFRAGLGLRPMAGDKSLIAEGENRYHAIFGVNPVYFVSASSFGPPLVALEAKVKIAGPDGKRELAVEQFFVVPQTGGDREIALKPNEIVTSIEVPLTANLKSATYEIREREAIDWPLATASVALKMKGNTVEKGRIVLGAVAPTPHVAEAASQMLAGKTINEATAEEIGKAAVAGAQPLSQNGYKVQLAKVAVKRALLQATGQLKA
jgi:xanthine dehydrogenase YagS FAD-binding subunit